MTKGLPRSRKNIPRAALGATKQLINLNGKIITITATGAAIGFGSLRVSDLPEGNILIQGIGGSLGFAAPVGGDAIATWAGDISFGSVATLDTDLTTPITNNDIDGDPTPDSIGAAVDHVIPLGNLVGSTPGAPILNTAGNLGVFLNMIIDDASIATDGVVPVTLSGNLELVYTVLGDS